MLDRTPESSADVWCACVDELEELDDELDELELLEPLAAGGGSNSSLDRKAWISAWAGEQALHNTCG